MLSIVIKMSSQVKLHICVPAFEVTGSSSQQDVVGMPVQTEDGGADRLLDVLTHPPVGKSKDIV